MVVRKARPADAGAITALHQRRLAFGLLSQLGEGFVAEFYSALIRSPLGCGVVAEQDGRIVGFTTGVTDWRMFSRTFIRTHIWTTARAAVFALRSGRWRRLLETVRYARAPNLPAAELVSIAVAPEVEGTGVAPQLARSLFAEFEARGVLSVRITTGGANTRSIRFFEKLGLRPQPLDMHKGESAVLFIVSLEPQAASPDPPEVRRAAAGTEVSQNI